MLQNTITESPRLQQAKKRPTGNLSLDGVTPIHVGDLVDYQPVQGTNNPGRVVAVYAHQAKHRQGDLIVWRTPRGTYDSWFASELVVVEAGKRGRK